MNAVRVLVADDQALVREGFVQSIGRQPDLTVIGQAADGVEAVRLARRLRPDVTVMDIRMPRMDGLTATEQILADLPDARVLVLTTFDADEYVFRALRAGASGFLLKDVPLSELAEAVRLVARGDAMLSPAVTRRVIARFANHPPTESGGGARRPSPPRRPIGLLSPRERDVLAELVRGLSNAEIAAELHLSEATVKTHVRAMLTKLDLRDRTQLVIAAHESGAWPAIHDSA